MVFSGSFRPIKISTHDNPSKKKSNTNGALITFPYKKKSCMWIRNIWRDLFDLTLFTELDFMLYSIGTFFLNVGGMPFYQHLVNCVVKRGLTIQQASFQITIIGFWSLICRIIFSFVSNMKCVSRVMIYSLGGGIGGVCIAVMFLGDTFIRICIITSVYGVSMGKYNYFIVTTNNNIISVSF